jgi:beta-glucosidase
MHLDERDRPRTSRWTTTARVALAGAAVACLAACGAGRDARSSAAAPETSPPAESAAPQLGKSSVPEVVAALTRDEKVLLVLGTGMLLDALPPERQGPVGGRQPMRVPGAAGQTIPVPRLGIPSIVLADGPAGLRIEPKRPDTPSESYYCTAFPIASALAASWNPALIEDVGKALGAEVRGYGVDVLLAPALNLHRVPLGGRNFEYYSEDPLLSGKTAAAIVRGVQSNGVGTSIKHFAANNHEWNRNVINVRVDERTLRELYLRGFEIAVREGQPWTVMSSYNRINGKYTSEDPALLTGILREQWGYSGLVMTDWFGGSDPAAQMNAGNDLLMPGTEEQRQKLVAALAGGALAEGALDRNVSRVLELILKTPAFAGGASAKVDLEAGARVSRAAGAEGMVLLQNERARLPLARNARLALFGNGSYDTLRGGTGSGNVNASHSVSLAAGLGAAGYAVDGALQQQYQEHIGRENAKQAPRAGIAAFLPVELAAEPALENAVLTRASRESDAAVITLRRSSGEFVDRSREDFELSAAEKALLAGVSKAFRAARKPVIVVLNVGGVIETASWRSLADAVLLAWQPGQEAGHAIADVLSGVVNPSGKLPTTFPLAIDDAAAMKGFPGTVLQPGDDSRPPPFGGAKAAEIEYAEQLAVGYRHFQSAGARVAYPFGHGLSYTTFGYGPLELTAGASPERWTLKVRVENTGKVAGAEVVQLYVSAPTGKLPKPTLELRAFAKTRALAPGEAEVVSFELGPRELASFDPDAGAWVAEAGKYTLRAAASATDIRRTATLELKSAAQVALR